MNQPLLNRTSSRVAVSLLGTLLAASAAQAAQIEYTAGPYTGGFSWPTAANWVGGVAPTGTDTASFNQTSFATISTVNSVAVNVNYNSATIAGIVIGDTTTSAARAGLGVNGSNLTLGSGGITIAANTGAVTFSPSYAGNIILSANQTWRTDSSNLFIVRSVISGAFQLEKTGTGALALDGVANTFSGGFKLTEGNVRLGHNSSLGSGTLTLNGGTLSTAGSSHRTITNAVSVTGNSTLGTAGIGGLVTLTGPVAVGNNGQLNYVNTGGAITGNVTLNGNLTLNSSIATVLAAPLNQTPPLTVGGNTIAGVIADGSGSFGLIKTGTGVVHLTGANTFTGGATINAGTLSTGATGTFGADDVTLATGATITAGNSASFADTALLSFASTSIGKINLNFTGADTIGGIYNSVSASFIGNGTYTATDLNTFFGGNVFAGAGSLTVFGAAIPEPSSFALVGGLAALGLVASRRRTRR